jgi:LysR family transcriptional regulator, regulator of abg operon
VRLTQIRDFVTVVECGSIRAAARQLGVSQPTITKSVRSLEAELHVRLLSRSAQGIAPTAAGRTFFARARVAHTELRKAEEEAAHAGGPGGGRVAFGVGNVAAALIVPEAVARFRRQFPRAGIRIVEGLAHLLLPSVRDESLDFVMGMRHIAALDPALRFRPLYRSELVVAARKGHPLRRARSLVDLAACEWLSTSTLSLQGGPLERLFASCGLPPPQPVIVCEYYNTVVALLATSDMIGLMQRRALQEAPASERLQEFAISEPIPVATAGIYTRADTPLTRAAAAMVKAASAVARELGR